MQKSAGFTLIELILVLAIIAVLSAEVLLSVSVPSLNVETTANQVASDIRYTQALSMTLNQHYRFVYVSASAYKITDGSGNAIKMALGNTSATFASGITFGAWSNLPSNLIVFDGEGIPYTDTGATTALAASASIPILSHGQTKTVVISPNTGRVIVQ